MNAMHPAIATASDSTERKMHISNLHKCLVVDVSTGEGVGLDMFNVLGGF
jgi:hypothetical protein